MAQTLPLAITISRELGSGGAYVGHKLAEELDIFYADHEIITRTAEKLSVYLDDIVQHEERIKSFWHSFWEKTSLHEFYNEATGSFVPTTARIFEAESDVMRQIAKEHSAVFIGRGGFHVLKDHPNIINIFLHGSPKSRVERLQDVRKISEVEAKTQIILNDKDRARYIKKFTKKDWYDTRNYDLTIDTGKIGFDNAVEIILKYIHARKL